MNFTGYENIVKLLLQFGAHSVSQDRGNEAVGVSSEALNVQSSTHSLGLFVYSVSDIPVNVIHQRFPPRIGSNTLKDESLEELRLKDCTSSSTTNESLNTSNSDASEMFTRKLSPDSKCIKPTKYQPLSRTDKVIKTVHVSKISSDCHLPRIAAINEFRRKIFEDFLSKNKKSL